MTCVTCSCDEVGIRSGDTTREPRHEPPAACRTVAGRRRRIRGNRAAEEAPIDCKDATHSAPGFWVGHWSVSPTGTKTPVATSRIEWIVGDCAIRETFEQTIGPGGKPMIYHGTSYTAFDTNEKTWRQFYVDDQGHASSFHGGIDDGKMVLVTDGPAVINRIGQRASGRQRAPAGGILDRRRQDLASRLRLHLSAHGGVRRLIEAARSSRASFRPNDLSS